MVIRELKELIQNQVGQSKVKEAIETLLNWTNNNSELDIINSIILLKGKYLELERNKLLGLLSRTDVLQEQSQISYSVLSIVSSLDMDSIRLNENLTEGNVTRILMLTANPAGTALLELEEEHSAIVLKLQNVQNKFSVIKKEVSRVSFKESIEEVNPDILHFSGHGDGEGIMVHNSNSNGSEQISAKSLDSLFLYLKEQGVKIKAVVLNACYTENQSMAIAKHIPYVIGTTVTVGDRIAKDFSIGYYFKLTQNNMDFENAFRSGVVQAEMSGAQKSDFIMFKNGKLLEI